jgi:hypothetical protein
MLDPTPKIKINNLFFRVRNQSKRYGNIYSACVIFNSIKEEENSWSI